MAFVPDALPDRFAGGPTGVDHLDRAILRTVTYAALFRAPLTWAQLHRVLMEVPAELQHLRARLAAPYLRARLDVAEDFILPRGRREWLDLREERRRHTADLLARHAAALRILARFPFVRLVALSGGCAHENATDGDVDIFLIVRRGRAWAVCLALMILSKLLGVRRTLCLNYIVDETGASLPEHDVFTAAEIVGMKPLAGREAYRDFVARNAWASAWYPNFFASYGPHSEPVGDAGAARWLEALLDLGPAQAIEAFSRRALGVYLRRKSRGKAGVVLAPERLKLHLQDHGPGLLDAFARALDDMERA